jgi:hypothetical protein
VDAEVLEDSSSEPGAARGSAGVAFAPPPILGPERSSAAACFVGVGAGI